jgi:hypothetical protein
MSGLRPDMAWGRGGTESEQRERAVPPHEAYSRFLIPVWVVNSVSTCSTFSAL